MTKILFTFFAGVFLMFSSAVYAQNQAQTGLKGGINFATFKDSDVDYDNRTGFVIGGFSKFPITGSHVSIQPEFLYSQKGAVSGGDEIRVDYLEVPILFKFAFAPEGAVQPNLFIGPYGSVLITSEYDAAGGGIFGDNDVNIEDETESIDYGGVIGIGFDVVAGSSIFTFDARYGTAFSDVFNNDSGKNSVVSFTVGISP